MSIIIGSARTSHADKPAQVSTQNYYNPKEGYWLAYEPIKSPHRLSRAMFEACENNNIGYSQPYRFTAESDWQNNIKSIAKIKNSVTCDCSSLVHLAIRQAYGVNLPGTFVTWTMGKIMTESGLFKEPVKVQNANQLKDGMILICDGHTVGVIDTNYLFKILVPHPILVKDDANEDVLYLQIALNKVMKSKLTEDAEFGEKTKAALMKFQTKYKLERSGIYDKSCQKVFKNILN